MLIRGIALIALLAAPAASAEIVKPADTEAEADVDVVFLDRPGNSDSAEPSTSQQTGEFRWPIPSEAHVVETRRTTGKPEAVMEYGIVLEASAATGEHLFRAKQNLLVKIDGEPIAADLQEAIAATFQAPLRIHVRGEVIGLKDEDGARAQYEGLVEGMTEGKPDAKAVRELMLRPEMVETAINEHMKRWAHWRNVVVDAPAQAGVETEGEGVQSSLVGDVGMTWVQRFEGPSPDLPGALRYVMQGEIDSDDIDITKLTDMMPRKSRADRKRAREAVEEMKDVRLSRVDHILADVEPDTLRPLRVTVTSKISASEPGGETKTRVEEIDYRFTWITHAQRSAEVRKGQVFRREPDADRSKPSVAEQYPPRYPPVAIRNKMQGSVLIDVVVDADGEVIDARVAESSGHAALDTEALIAVRAWRFHPALVDGKAVTGSTRVPVNFKMN